MSGDNDFGSTFETLFCKDEQTPEERGAERLRWKQEQHEREQQAFERERDRRAEYIAMDNRIRRIIGEEVGKLYFVGLTLIATYCVGHDYGWPAGVAVVVAAMAWHWWEDRKQRKKSIYKINEVDELAEDTVQHERIAELEEAGQLWLNDDADYVDTVNVYDAPYWERVNKKVRSFAGMPYPKRMAENKAARERSLPYRQAMKAKLRTTPKFSTGEYDLPYWARITEEEAKGSQHS